MIVDKSQITYKIESISENLHECVAYLDTTRVCRCKISVKRNTTWTISAWYTEKEFQHNGIGILTMHELLKFLYEKYSTPLSVEYIWDGTNSYVYEWLDENFGAISKCPIAVQKTAADDDWESHIYYLNTEKVVKYFELA